MLNLSQKRSVFKTMVDVLYYHGNLDDFWDNIEDVARKLKVSAQDVETYAHSAEPSVRRFNNEKANLNTVRIDDFVKE